jgi:hypothetical protein
MQDKATIQEIAEKRAHGSPSARAAWQNALESFPDLPDNLSRTVLGAIPSHESTRMLARFIARESDPERSVGTFLKLVDESPEPLQEWLKAFEIFALFIESTVHRPNLAQATGYLRCCVSMAGTSRQYTTFPMAVETMLETYGYTGEGG